MATALASVTVTVAAAALLAITVTPAGAQANKCDASKLKATGTKCYGKAKCVVKAASKGDPIDGVCNDRAEAKFMKAFAKAEGKGGCSTTGDTVAIEGKVDAHILDLTSELWPDPTENDCASAKLKAAGKKCSCKLKCRSKAAAKGVPVDLACLSKCETKFALSFVKAEDKGGCTTTGDANAIEMKVDAFVTDAATEIQPSATSTTTVPTTTITTTTTTTTTTTLPSTCGNGMIEGSEECDDSNTTPGDGCSATCQLESVNPAVCAGVPTGSGATLDTVLFQSGFTMPVHVTAPRLDPSRVFVVEQEGRIKMVKGGVTTTFLDISTKVACCGERGLLSMAFHPDYENNGFFYVYYTQNAPNPQPDGNLIIARYHASSPDVGDVGSETILVPIPHTSQVNHNGGNLNFGPDGFLYAGTGDGGGSGDPGENAQNDSSQLGKILRIDPTTGAATNWAKGLRNPFRWSFDRANGDVYIGDVGQGRWEEIDYVPANPSGVNYGWDDMEGRHCFEPSVGCLTAGRTLPVLEYCNSAFSDPACSTFQSEKGQAVTGGFVYRGCAMPDLQGRYFYSDFYTAFIRSFMGVSGGNAQNLQNNTTDVDPPGALAINNVSSFGEDTRGELYIVDYDGEIFKIVPGS
jgi:hypothetical protein